MAVVAQVLARLRREPLSADDDCALAQQVDQLCHEQNHHWRDRLLTPLVTIRLVLLQVLHGNTAITHLRQLVGFDFAASSFCEARQRLTLWFWQELVRWTSQLVADERGGGGGGGGVGHSSLLGMRVLIADCSSFSTSDTPELSKHFGPLRARGAKAGVSYPVAKLVGLMDAATGLFVQLLAVPLYTHDLRHTLSVHGMLRFGDILLGDRAYCSFAHIALLNLRGVFACFRLHQRRKANSSGTQRWRRGPKAPVWLTQQQWMAWMALPAWLDVRIVCYNVVQRGFRTRQVIVATTLFDTVEWPDSRVAELYGHRWRVETCFDDLKTTMRLNVLKCQSVDGVMKELAAYLLVYNLVRLAMLRAAKRQGQSVWRISFIDALRWLAARMMGLPGVERLIENPLRSGRSQPRVIRRRMKEYDLMNKPRSEYEPPGKSAGMA